MRLFFNQSEREVKNNQMKTKLSAIVIVAVLLAGIVSADKMFVSAASETPADQMPVQGIDVQVEKSADGAVIASKQTDNNGNFVLVNTKPGHYVFTYTRGVNVKASKKIVGYLVTINANGEAIATETWADPSVPFKMELKLPGPDPQTLIGNVLTVK